MSRSVLICLICLMIIQTAISPVGSYLSAVKFNGPKLIPVNDQPSFVSIIAHFAGYHFDGHADLDGSVVHVGELGGDHGAFVQFYQGNCIRCVGVVSAGGFIDGGVGIHFTFAAECVEGLGFVAAAWADITRGEDLVIAVGAHFSDQSVALFFESPMSWDFHE